MTNKYEEAKVKEKLLEKTIEELQNKLTEYCNNIDFGSNNIDIANKVANDFVILNRKCIFIEENETKISKENTNLKTELQTLSNELAYKIKEFEISRTELLFKISNLEKKLQNSVPKESLQELNKKFCDLTVKYHEVLHNEEKLLKENHETAHFKKEIELLINEKNSLNDELLKYKVITHADNIETNDLAKQLAASELKELSERQRADHTNSLYELVKDQLSKSEERCRELDNQNKMLIASNLKLQLVQQENHDKLINCVSQNEYKSLETKHLKMCEELHTLKIINEQLANKVRLFENETIKKDVVKMSYDTEFMNLKHLVLDLQSASDDKALIARLGTDLVMARLCESDARNKVEILTKEIQGLNDSVKEKEKLLNEKNEQLNILTAAFNNKYKYVFQ